MTYWSDERPSALQANDSTIEIGRLALKRVLKAAMTTTALVLLCTTMAAAESRAERAQQLALVSGPTLVQCAPVSPVPCFSIVLTPADGTGTPAAVALPAKDRLLQSMQVQADGTTLSPFYVSAGADGSASRRPNIVLIEVDISGSMNSGVGQGDASGKSRFEAAQAAIAKYLETMQEGVDEIAIVPFESHHVVSTIQAAVFTSSRSEALAQLRALPRPEPKNNTALYQAVFTGVQAMQNEMASRVKPGTTAEDFQPRVIVMTDGKNEVAKGDDADLLDGPLGMQQAVAKVSSSGLDVVGIGFGDRNEIDTEALTRLSKRIFLASTGDELVQIFRNTTPLKTSDLQVTFQSPWTDRPSLASRDPQFVFTLELQDGRRLTSAPMRYLTPAMGAPLYERRASAEELTALLASRPAANSGWDAVLRSMLVFVGFGVLLLLLWFWIPRLIWGDQYSGSLAAVSAERRWGKDAGVKASGVQMRTVTDAPDGFDADQVRAKQQRSASQITQVQPRGENAKNKVQV